MNIHTFFSQLNQLYAVGEQQDTESFLQQSLQQARKGDQFVEIMILNELRSFYRNTGQMEKSLFYMEQVLENNRAAGLAEGTGWGTILLNAATACRVAGDEERALELYREAEEVYRRYLPKADSRFAAVYSNMSSIYAERGEQAAAVGLLLRALKIMADRADTAIEQAVMRADLARLYLTMGQDQAATAELELALSIYEKHTGPNGEMDPNYASALAALAASRYREGRYGEAAVLSEQALKEIHAHCGENQDYYVMCRHCAQVYQALGDEDKAAQYLTIAEGGQQEDNQP